jgi:hypothetical protein
VKIDDAKFVILEPLEKVFRGRYARGTAANCIWNRIFADYSFQSGSHVKIDDANGTFSRKIIQSSICEGNSCPLHLEPNFCGLLVPILGFM